MFTRHWQNDPILPTFLMKATEKVSQETMPWSMSSTKAVNVKESRSPKLKDTRQQPLATSLPLTCADRRAKLQPYRATRSEMLIQQEDREEMSFRRAAEGRELAVVQCYTGRNV